MPSSPPRTLSAIWKKVKILNLHTWLRWVMIEGERKQMKNVEEKIWNSNRCAASSFQPVDTRGKVTHESQNVQWLRTLEIENNKNLAICFLEWARISFLHVHFFCHSDVPSELLSEMGASRGSDELARPTLLLAIQGLLSRRLPSSFCSLVFRWRWPVMGVRWMDWTRKIHGVQLNVWGGGRELGISF